MISSSNAPFQQGWSHLVKEVKSYCAYKPNSA